MQKAVHAGRPSGAGTIMNCELFDVEDNPPGHDSTRRTPLGKGTVRRLSDGVDHRPEILQG
ncbi:MAG: hypothetical protein V1755_08740, partial [Chloroflexota bacterium]